MPRNQKRATANEQPGNLKVENDTFQTRATKKTRRSLRVLADLTNNAYSGNDSSRTDKGKNDLVSLSNTNITGKEIIVPQKEDVEVDSSTAIRSRTSLLRKDKKSKQRDDKDIVENEDDNPSTWYGEGVMVRAGPGCPRGLNSTNPPPHLEDIDLRHPDDPLYCPEYVKDIYSYLRSLQYKFPLYHMDKVQAKGLNRSVRVNTAMRAILIDWLVEVAEEYMLLSDTLYICVKYVDRFLSAQAVPRRDLQLVGCACLLLAAKYEEQFAPGVDEFVIISDKSYDRKEILKMEIMVLKELDYRLTVCTAKTFLRRFQRAACTTGTEKHLSNYLAELTLTCYELMSCPPDVIAASCVYLARLALYASDTQSTHATITSVSFKSDADAWTPELEYYSGFSGEYLAKVIQKVGELHMQAWCERGRAIFEKYALPVFDCVSKTIRPYTGSSLPSIGPNAFGYDCYLPYPKDDEKKT